MLFILFFAFCVVVISSRPVKHEKISCEGFKTQKCLDLAYEYYGLSEKSLDGYSELKQIMLADSIECHYLYDVCPFYVPPITENKKECIDNKIEFIDETGNINYYLCDGVDLLSFIPLSELGSNNNASGSDIWGYQTYDDNGLVAKHYAMTSQADGSSIVDITNPLKPNVLAFIESNVEKPLRNVLWRDVKVYKDFAIIAADTVPINDHSIQIYNLTKIINDAYQYQLLNGMHNIYRVPVDDIIIYDEIGGCHNIYIESNLGHLYAFGSNGINGNECGDGIHIVDINNPNDPMFLGCYDGAGFVHDAQCVIYHGPDVDYNEHEICFMFTPRHGNLTIIDITDPTNIVEISRATYFSDDYNHQGWVTSNHEYLLLDDEGDEAREKVPSQTTYIFDIRDLDHPHFIKAYHSGLNTRDHNQYILDNGYNYSCSHHKYKGYSFQANYEYGLRILNIDNISNENNNTIYEIAYFDVYPWKYYKNGSNVYDDLRFFGSWSVYPYFNEIGTHPNDNIYSKTIITESTTTGLYVLSFRNNRFALDDETESDGFQFDWNSWYVYLSISIVAVLLFGLGIWMICKSITIKHQNRSGIKVYEKVMDMEQTNKYGTSN